MKTLRLALLVVVAATIVYSCAAVEGDRTVSCGGSHHMKLVELAISPDPIADGQQVNRWLVRLIADSSGECRTVIRVYERPGNELVAQARVPRLRPGPNEIALEPTQRHRFDGSDNCYQVTVDIAGTDEVIDTSRRFCARRAPGGGRRWTLQRPPD
jgi:hypothetical protein